jgi:hypothetical protein
MGARPLHGDIAQSQREATLAGYRAGKFNVLVATDVAARGLDITGVELVVQMEPPKDPETYIHRSGRTGRAGMTGVCITMVTRKHEERIPYIEKKAGFKFERIGAPQPSEVATIAAERWGAGRRPPGPPGCCPPLCPPGSLAPPPPPLLLQGRGHRGGGGPLGHPLLPGGRPQAAGLHRGPRGGAGAGAGQDHGPHGHEGAQPADRARGLHDAHVHWRAGGALQGGGGGGAAGGAAGSGWQAGRLAGPA